VWMCGEEGVFNKSVQQIRLSKWLSAVRAV